MLKNRDIICVSASDWTMPWGSKQHLMLKLAEHNRVLYVEYQGSFLDFVKYPKYFFKRLNRLNRIRQVSKNIYVYTPITLLPFGSYFMFIAKLNQLVLGMLLRKIANKLNFKDVVLWAYLPSSVYLVGRIGEVLAIYHCAADFANEKANVLRRKLINRLEGLMLKKAQVVLALTKNLCEKFKKHNKNTFYFPSAVDAEYFGKIREGNADEPSDLAPIKKPRLGVIGYLDGNILDLGILNNVSQADDGWSLVMIGPLFRNKNLFCKLRKNKNVYFLGEKPPSSIPLYIKYLDICLIPYVRNQFTSNVSPIKLYEYLAMGKPVITSSFLDELKDYGSVIKVANSKENFVDLIRTTLQHIDEKEILAARISLANENSWQSRLDFLENKLNLIGI